MPHYTNNALNCTSIRAAAMEGNRSQLLAGYGPTKEQQSVYSSQCSIEIERGTGTCAGCHGDHELVNGYCDTCRTMGANEKQCLNPRLLKRRSATGRENSKDSMWRHSRL
jgi:hypothetical protein